MIEQKSAGDATRKPCAATRTVSRDDAWKKRQQALISRAESAPVRSTSQAIPHRNVDLIARGVSD